MKDRRLDRLFERYRRRGDVEALGKVFDLASSELLRVAMFLAKSPAAAEDLLQATFLTAIERAARYDGSRTLLPWLLGILVNHAHEARRSALRSPDPERLDPRAAADPHAELEARELDRELEQALARLSAGERAVLEPFLCEGKAPIDLARERGLAPGTVRMRIHRGLARLRELLPAGLALGGALLVAGGRGGRGTAAVRASVLQAGARAAPPLAAVGAGAASIAPLVLGGSLVAKKIVLVVLSIALVGVLGWIARDGLGGARGELDASPPPLAAVAAPTETKEPLDLDRPAGEPSELTDVSRVSVAERPKEPASAYEAALAGVTGRLVEPDGRPAPGVHVRLLELPLDRVQSWLGVGAESASELEEELARGIELAVSRTRTDAEGRFVLGGARPDALHALGGGSASPRVPLRLIGEPLGPATLVDLGDVVLRERASLRGVVRDEQGRPVEGARVRAGTLPDEAFLLGIELGTQDVAADVALALGFGEPPLVLALPAWIARLEDHLGLAVARTDREGRFELAEVPAGDLDVFADRSGYVTGVLQGVPVPPDDITLVEVTLSAGQTVRGRVLAADGMPLAGVRVCAGAGRNDAGAPFWFLRDGNPSDADGRFAVGGLPDSESWIVAARPDETSPWTVTRSSGEGECELRLPGRGTLTLHAQDERGRPVTGAKPRLGSDARASMLPALLVRAPELGKRARETSPGTFVVEGLSLGEYLCSASAPGLASEPVPVTVDGPRAEATLVLAATRRITARILDAATSAPVPGALVALGVRELDGLFDGPLLSSARAGPDGEAVLEVRRRGGREPAELYLRASHPGYATAFQAGLQGSSVELRLSAGGALHALLDPVPPEGMPFLLVLFLQDSPSGFEGEGMRMLRLDERGEARLSHLAPGRWHYELVRGWAKDADMVSLLDGEEPEDVESGEFEVREGETAELVIHHGALATEATLGTGTGTVEGIVSIDGEPAQDLVISLSSPNAEEAAEVKLAPDGTFLFTDVPSGEHYLIVQSSREGKRHLTEPTFACFEYFQLATGETKRFDLAWSTTRVVIEVRGEHGEAAPGVQLEVSGGAAHTTIFTDGAGRAGFALIGSGEFDVTAKSPELGVGRADFEVREGAGLDPIEIRLSAGVPCAGTVRLDGTPADGQASLLFHTRGSGMPPLPVSVEISAGASTFRAIGLVPGTYEVFLLGFEQDYDRARFELGPSGNESIELVFRPR